MKRTAATAVRTALTVGETYRTRCGAEFRVLERTGEDDYRVRMQSGWTQEIHGVWQYRNGHIEWDRSSGGYWEEVA